MAMFGYIINEEKRSDLPDSSFGIPEDRKYPLDTEEHVRSAIKLFGHAEESKKKSLAQRINKAANKYGIEIPESTQCYKYLHEDYIEENYVFSKNDLYINFEKFESGQSNICLVTGLSGSGKSTISSSLASKYNTEWIELDIFEHCYSFTDDALKQAGQVFYDYLSSHKDLWDKLKARSIKGKDLGEEINKFVHYCISWCKKDKKNKYIIEGVQIYSFMKYKEIKSYPLIIKNTSMVKSIIQRWKRNGNGKINLSDELKNEFPQLVSWYKDEEKSLAQFRKSITENYNYFITNDNGNEHFNVAKYFQMIMFQELDAYMVGNHIHPRDIESDDGCYTIATYTVDNEFNRDHVFNFLNHVSNMINNSVTSKYEIRDMGSGILGVAIRPGHENEVIDDIDNKVCSNFGWTNNDLTIENIEEAATGAKVPKDIRIYRGSTQFGLSTIKAKRNKSNRIEVEASLTFKDAFIDCLDTESSNIDTKTYKDKVQIYIDKKNFDLARPCVVYRLENDGNWFYKSGKDFNVYRRNSDAKVIDEYEFDSAAEMMSIIGGVELYDYKTKLPIGKNIVENAINEVQMTYDIRKYNDEIKSLKIDPKKQYNQFELVKLVANGIHCNKLYGNGLYSVSIYNYGIETKRTITRYGKINDDLVRIDLFNLTTYVGKKDTVSLPRIGTLNNIRVIPVYFNDNNRKDVMFKILDSCNNVCICRIKGSKSKITISLSKNSKKMAPDIASKFEKDGVYVSKLLGDIVIPNNAVKEDTTLVADTDDIAVVEIDPTNDVHSVPYQMHKEYGIDYSIIKKAKEAQERNPELVIFTCKTMSRDEFDALFNQFKGLSEKQRKVCNRLSLSIYGYNMYDMYNKISVVIDKISHTKEHEIDTKIEPDLVTTSNVNETLQNYMDYITQEATSSSRDKGRVAEMLMDLHTCDDYTFTESVLVKRFINDTISLLEDNTIDSTLDLCPYFTPEKMQSMGVYNTNENDNYYHSKSDMSSLEWYKSYCEYKEVIDKESWYVSLTERYNDLIKNPSDHNRQRVLELGWNPELYPSIKTIKEASEYTKQALLESTTLNNIDLTKIDWSKYSINESTNNNLVPIFIVTSYTETAFGKVIRKWTKGRYTHASITFDTTLKQLYTFNLANGRLGGGLSIESLDGYIQECKDALIKVQAIFVKPEELRIVKQKLDEYIANYKKLHYGTDNLLNVAFQRARQTDEVSMICSEFVTHLLKFANVDITGKSDNIVTPLDLANTLHKNVYLIYEGFADRYDTKAAEKLVNKLQRTAHYINEASMYTDDVSKKLLSYINRDITPLLEAKIDINDEGDLTVTDFKKINFDSEYHHSMKLLKVYNTNKNYEGMKYELAKLWYLNSLLENKLYNNRNIFKKDLSNYNKMRSKILNLFNTNLKLVTKVEPDFDFQSYYQTTKFYDNKITITKSTMNGIVDITKRFLK